MVLCNPHCLQVFLGLGLVCSGCIDPGTADDLTMTLSFSFPDPGYEARLEFGDGDSERFRLGEKQENLGSPTVTRIVVGSEGRDDADSIEVAYCFNEPVLLVDVAGQVESVVLIAAGGCTNSGPGAWADPVLLE